jgi:hypothetical protein
MISAASRLVFAVSSIRLFGIAACAAAALSCSLPAARTDDVVLSYREESPDCEGCPGYELEFRSAGIVRFRGLRACAVPGEHIYRIAPSEFDELVRAFRECGPRVARSWRNGVRARPACRRGVGRRHSGGGCGRRTPRRAQPCCIGNAPPGSWEQPANTRASARPRSRRQCGGRRRISVDVRDYECLARERGTAPIARSAPGLEKPLGTHRSSRCRRQHQLRLHNAAGKAWRRGERGRSARAHAVDARRRGLFRLERARAAAGRRRSGVDKSRRPPPRMPPRRTAAASNAASHVRCSPNRPGDRRPPRSDASLVSFLTARPARSARGHDRPFAPELTIALQGSGFTGE